MSDFDWGALVVFAIGALAYVVSLEVRLKNVQNKLIDLKQRNIDAQIESDVHGLSDADLDADLSKDLGE